MDDSTTITELKDEVQGFIHERQWESYHTPKDLSMAITIEASELMEHFLFSQLSTGDVIADPALLEKVGDEIADVFIYLMSLVTALGVDLSEIFRAKMVKNRNKYPVMEFHEGNYEKR